jgi:hypothetical protein
MRQPKPEDIPQDIWEAFNDWANSEGVGLHPDDWQPWWECWNDGLQHGRSDYAL